MEYLTLHYWDAFTAGEGNWLCDSLHIAGVEATALEAEVAAAAQENQRLEATIEAAGTEEGVKDIARQKLGLAESGEIVFYDIGG